MIPENDPALRSWIESANDSAGDFPIQNLPFGVFSRKDDDRDAQQDRRIGIAIGEMILDLRALEEGGLLAELDEHIRCAVHASTLNHLMSLGRGAWRSLRSAISALLRHDNPRLRDDDSLRAIVFVPMREATMHLPAHIRDYTDFYASVHHATNVGSMFRPDNPLLPNYKHLPVGYHGRASSIVISGTPVRRPMGQVRPDDDKPPLFAPSRLLDYEMEMGFFVGAGNAMGERITIERAPQHIFGMVIVNDWSARDVQKWEYQPLGPFNSKNFATTISPWVVTLDALEPYRIEGPPRDNIGSEDPPTLDYLRPRDDAEGSQRMSLDVTCEVWLRPQVQSHGSSSATDAHHPPPDPLPQREGATDATLISRGNLKDMYWTIAQMLVHHTSTGCNMQPGDLLATGTISGPTEDSRGCLLERTWRGQNPVTLADGSQRKFLQDGDEVIMRCYCADGDPKRARRIGFGECTGVILPARA